MNTRCHNNPSFKPPRFPSQYHSFPHHPSLPIGFIPSTSSPLPESSPTLLNPTNFPIRPSFPNPQFQISESSPIGHQSMEPRSLFLAALLAAVSLTATAALFPSDALNSAAPKAIADLREAIVKGLGTQAEGVSLTGFDVQDALVGQALSYEFSIEVNNEVIPVRLLEDVSRWDFVDLPIFRSEVEGEGKVLAKPGMRTDGVVPVLAPFQLAGPMELWIQDGDDMRLALPHDVDAGKLKKVILSDGAVVTVKGARSVSLRHPLELPLPLNRTNHQSNPFASGLLTIADALRQSSRNDEIPLLSLRIVGPTSITSTPSESVSDKLKLKLLAPGLVQLSSRSIPSVTEDMDESVSTLWPLTSLNGSDATLMGIEELLASVLRKKGSSEGSFRLVKADVSARTYVKMGFVVEKKLLGKEVDWNDFPEWKTKPEKVRAHYEVLARVEENGKVIPERIAEVHPFQVQESFEESLLTGNVSMSHVPIVHPPPAYFTL